MTVADYAQHFKINPARFLQILAEAGITAQDEKDELILTGSQKQQLTQLMNKAIITDHDKTKERDNGISPAHILSPLHIAKKIIHQSAFAPRPDAPESEPNIKMSVAQYAQLFKISPQHFLHYLAAAGIPVQNTQDFLTLTCVKKNVAQPVNPPHRRSEKKDNEETEL